jgi:hypothetical protein
MSDRERIREDETFTIRHNLRSADTDGIIREFIENDTHRRKRKNGVVLYHEILSYSPKDTQKLNLEILEDIAQKFIELRGDRALCLAKPHIENKNVHIHFCFSGTEYHSSKVLRLDNKAFKQLRIDIERYQQEKYPELSDSIIYLNKWQKEQVIVQDEVKMSDSEVQLKKRTGNQSDKEQINELVQQSFQDSSSRDDFFQKLLQQGLELYKYRNKVNGLLWNGRKYRFRTLNISEKQLAQLQKGSGRMAELQRIMNPKPTERDFER